MPRTRGPGRRGQAGQARPTPAEMARLIASRPTRCARRWSARKWPSWRSREFVRNVRGLAVDGEPSPPARSSTGGGHPAGAVRDRAHRGPGQLSDAEEKPPRRPPRPPGAGASKWAQGCATPEAWMGRRAELRPRTRSGPPWSSPRVRTWPSLCIPHGLEDAPEAEAVLAWWLESSTFDGMAGSPNGPPGGLYRAACSCSPPDWCRR